MKYFEISIKSLQEKSSVVFRELPREIQFYDEENPRIKAEIIEEDAAKENDWMRDATKIESIRMEFADYKPIRVNLSFSC